MAGQPVNGEKEAGKKEKQQELPREGKQEVAQQGKMRTWPTAPYSTVCSLAFTKYNHVLGLLGCFGNLQ